MSEIGVFLKVVITEEKETKAETLSNIWLGTHLEYKGIQEIIKSLSIDYKEHGDTPTNKVAKEWRRLASFMSKVH